MEFLKRLFGGRPSQSSPGTSPPGLVPPPARLPVGPAPRWVSAWVGDFTDELDLDGYLGPEFHQDHGTARHEGSEYAILPAPVPISDLIGRAYLSNLWGPRMVEVAERSGVTQASCLLVYLHYRHEPSRHAKGPLRFLGSVQFETG